jgi:hypothetical protein
MQLTCLSDAVSADDDSGGESDPEADRPHAEEEEDGEDGIEEPVGFSLSSAPAFVR